MKINFHKTLIIIFVFGTCLICANNLFAQETPEDTTIIKVTGVDTTNFDHSVSPSDDFYRYVNGKWLNRNKIPAGRSRWSPIFELNGNNEKIARKLLLQSMNGNYGKESSMKKAGDFYFSAMDTNSIEKLGYDPVKPYLETINNINDKEQYVKVLAKLSKSGLGSLFGIAAEPDDKDNSNVIVELTQGGLGLPERDYYLAKDPQSIDIRNKYSDLIVKLLILTGDDHGTAESKAQKIMDIETHLADISMDNVTMRDLKATYNKMSYDQLLSKYPALKFEIFFEILGINDPEYFRTGLNVETPDFFASLNTYFQTEDLENLKTYLRWKILSKSSQFLSSEFRNAYFDFNSKTLRGIKSKQLRWKDAVNIVESNIGQIVGEAFVKQNFSPESKEKVKQMVGNILLSLKDRISNLEWMNEDTKKKAYEKISTFRVLIGYPDKWKDYSSLEISRNSLFNN
ncbi:MAG: M13 family metallopeptidase N-terminal domain-containing protein, partial [bacterium]